MNRRFAFLVLLMFSIALLTSCSSEDNQAPVNAQSLQIVIFQGTNYMITDEEVTSQEIEDKVGEVNSYSAKNGEHYVEDAFSNAYPVGTGLYKLKEVDVIEAITLKTEEGTYLRTVRR